MDGLRPAHLSASGRAGCCTITVVTLLCDERGTENSTQTNMKKFEVVHDEAEQQSRVDRTLMVLDQGVTDTCLTDS